MASGLQSRLLDYSRLPSNLRFQSSLFVVLVSVRVFCISCCLFVFGNGVLGPRGSWAGFGGAVGEAASWTIPEKKTGSLVQPFFTD